MKVSIVKKNTNDVDFQYIVVTRNKKNVYNLNSKVRI